MRKILEELGSRDTIAIGGHVRPDGDCVGSCMGMYLYLKKAPMCCRRNPAGGK